MRPHAFSIYTDHRSHNSLTDREMVKKILAQPGNHHTQSGHLKTTLERMCTANASTAFLLLPGDDDDAVIPRHYDDLWRSACRNELERKFALDFEDDLDSLKSGIIALKYRTFPSQPLRFCEALQ
jgi:hypothetical protein